MIKLKEVSYCYPFQEKWAVNDLSISIDAGECVLLTGPSGCGKSTVIRLINGLAPHYYKGELLGKISIAGKGNDTRHIQDISRDVETLFQDPEQQFFTLNVGDELSFALECRGVDPRKIELEVTRASQRFGLQHLMDAAIFDLSEGEKQKVALASMLFQKSGILVLDEPTANLDPDATMELSSLLMSLKLEGLTIVIADHRLYWLKDVVDRVMVLQDGKLCATGDFSILEKKDIRQTYGLRRAEIDSINNHPIPFSGEKQSSLRQASLSIKKITFAHKNGLPIFENDTISISMGAVTAITGKNGVGKTTFARLITGLIPLKKGKIYLGDDAISPGHLLKIGSIVLQNTDHQLHMKTVFDELYLSAKRMAKVDRKIAVDQLLERFNLTEFSGHHPQSLSGGQKQRLVIASSIIKRPKILILDEPTSGL